MTNAVESLSRSCILFVVVTLFGGSAGALAEDGISKSEVILGMANAQSGAAAGLGTGMKAGALAYFDRVNAAGGVGGRKITLLVKDDGYEPARSAAATESLIHADKVFALLGYVGTPTSAAAVPVASKAQVPYLFPFTGAEFLRNPVGKFVFTMRASYFDETEIMVERLIKDLGVKKIALLMQDDAFGEAVKGGVARALFRRDMKIHAEARIKRNSMEIDAGVDAMKQAQPEAIVFVGTYKQMAAAVKKAKATGLKARFLTVSFIGTENFIAEAGADGEGVYITQVVPSPHDTSLPIVKDYLADIKGNNVGYTSFEGYINAAVLVEAMKKAGAEPTRASLLAALESLKIDLGGVAIQFSAASHQGSKSVFLTRVQEGKAVSQTKMQ
ncbi:MAG: ABC transporter substrate-binding protein [Rhodoferax sp.]|nr:ABC transporter substrate-binding protein [Rhodoferax sp.]